MANHHHHHHHHHHGHGHSSVNIGQANQAHFDNIAESLDSTPWIQTCLKQATEELQRNVEWIGVRSSEHEKSKLLDYACGTGVISRALAPYVGQVRGIDISQGMLKEFDRLRTEAGHSEEKMRAVWGDLLDPAGTPGPELDGPEFRDFDVVAMGYALHHVDDTQNMIQKLSERLRPGGTLLIIDFIGKHASELGGGADFVAHGGFVEDQLRVQFQKAGLDRNWGWKLFEEKTAIPVPVPTEKQVFMARAIKGSEEKTDL